MILVGMIWKLIIVTEFWDNLTNLLWLKVQLHQSFRFYDLLPSILEKKQRRFLEQCSNYHFPCKTNIIKYWNLRNSNNINEVLTMFTVTTEIPEFIRKQTQKMTIIILGSFHRNMNRLPHHKNLECGKDYNMSYSIFLWSEYSAILSVIKHILLQNRSF